MSNLKTYKLTKGTLPAHATHPGEILSDEIEYRKIKQKDLAKSMDISPTVLNELIHGKRNITADIAMRLEKALDIDASYWMRLQARFEIDTIRIREKHSALALASEPDSRYLRKKKTKN